MGCGCGFGGGGGFGLGEVGEPEGGDLGVGEVVFVEDDEAGFGAGDAVQQGVGGGLGGAGVEDFDNQVDALEVFGDKTGGFGHVTGKPLYGAHRAYPVMRQASIWMRKRRAVSRAAGSFCARAASRLSRAS